MMLQPLPTSADPHENVKEYADYGGELRDSCEVVVVGSGPGGAVVAKELAEAGRDVVLLEEGPPCGKEDFIIEPGECMQRWFREGSGRASRGNLFSPTMQANALGGGSVFNSAICARSPSWVFDKWAGRCGTEDLDLAALEPHYERVEAALSIAPTPEQVQGKRNLLFKKGCEALGMSPEPTWRNVDGCKGSAECMSGCRNGAKKSVDITYVPAAMQAGARVYTGVRAERIVSNGRRATAVTGHLVEPFTQKRGGPVHIDAQTVVLAAGCMASPLILRRSGIGNGWVGKDLQFHPGFAIMAVYPDPIEPWQGATQGYHCLDYLEEGMKFEVLWVPPGLLAARIPGVGKEYLQHLLRFSHLAPFDVIVHTQHSTASVGPKPGSPNPDIQFHMDQRDADLLKRGAEVLADICFASGAEAILPGIHGMPEVIHSKEEARIIHQTKMKATDPITASNHAFGTTRMSAKPSEGVVDTTGRCHDSDNVYVADTGIFSGSPAVNPMLTCMALADRIALGIAERW